MTEYLKGNYPLDVKITEEQTGCNAFERLALSKLGGSICFVKKAPMVWTGDDGPEAA